MSEQELDGESVVFVKVAPGYYQKATGTLQGRQGVREVRATTGRHDLAVIGSWGTLEELQDFVSGVRGIDFVRNVQCYPSLSTEETESDPQSRPQLFGAWTLIRSSNPEKTIAEIRKMNTVRSLFRTIGSADIVAQIEAESAKELLNQANLKIQSAPNVTGQETFPTYSL